MGHSTRRVSREGSGARGEIFRTTLLDLLLGIDEFEEDEQESLATALRLLQGGRLRLISRAAELGDEGALLPRSRLHDLIRADHERRVMPPQRRA